MRNQRSCVLYGSGRDLVTFNSRVEIALSLSLYLPPQKTSPVYDYKRVKPSASLLGCDAMHKKPSRRLTADKETQMRNQRSYVFIGSRTTRGIYQSRRNYCHLRKSSPVWD